MQPIEFYTDYRKYLIDSYQDRKKRFNFFSYRYFCKKAGIASPSLFKEVCSGKRNLTDVTIASFAKGLGLKDAEAKYFEALVLFNQSNNPREKQQLLDKMRGLKQLVKVRVIPADQFAYYEKWYNPVIRELACTIDWKSDFALLGKAVVPAITRKQARQSVDLLLKLGFLTKSTAGGYRQSDPAISTGPEVASFAVRTLNRELSKLGEESIDRFPATARDVSTLVIGISSEGYCQIKQEIQEFKRRIIQITHNDKRSDQVYSMNVQLFPVSVKNTSEEANNESPKN